MSKYFWQTSESRRQDSPFTGWMLSLPNAGDHSICLILENHKQWWCQNKQGSTTMLLWQRSATGGQNGPIMVSCFHCHVCSIPFNRNWHVCSTDTADLTRRKDHAVMTCVNIRGQDSPLDGWLFSLPSIVYMLVHACTHAKHLSLAGSAGLAIHVYIKHSFSAITTKPRCLD